MTQSLNLVPLPWRWLKNRRFKPGILLKIYTLLGWDIQKSVAVMAHVFDTSKRDFLLADWPEKYIVSTKDRIIGRVVYCSGVFELNKFEQAKRLYGKSTSAMTFVDIGANIGTMCIPMVARGHFAGAIALEPEPLNARLLRAKYGAKRRGGQDQGFGDGGGYAHRNCQALFEHG